MTDSVDRLYKAIVAARELDPVTSRTARLLQRGQAKMAKKLAEEAIEVVIDAVAGNTDAVVRESADLIYNLTVLWAASGVHPRDVWAEMERRERLLGIAEKLPKRSGVGVTKKHPRTSTVLEVAKPAVTAGARQPVIALDTRRAPKRR